MKMNLIIIKSLLVLFATKQVLAKEHYIFEDKSFILRSEIHHNKQKSSLHCTEYYSAERHRVRVKFDHHSTFQSYGYRPNQQKLKDEEKDVSDLTTSGGSSGLEFYHDCVNGQSLFLNPATRECRNGSIEEFYQSLFKDLILFDFLKRQYSKDGQEELNKRIVGPTNLLFLIANHIKDINLVTANPLNDIRSREIPVVEYMLTFAHENNQILSLNIFYNKANYGEDIPYNSVPLEIRVSINDDINVVIHIFDYKILDTSSAYEGSNDLLAFDNKIHQTQDKAIDLFSFPVSFNCSAFLVESAAAQEDPSEPEVDLFEGMDLEKMKFSFSVHTERPFVEGKQEHRVFFDGNYQLMRVDSAKAKWRTSTTSILDFKTNRKYTIVDKGAYKSGRRNLQKEQLVEEKLGEPEVVAASKIVVLPRGGPMARDSHCSATRLDVSAEGLSTGDRLLIPADVSRMLFGAAKFTFMGWGRVRGMRVQIYEAYSRQMPHWLGQPVCYKDKNNKYSMRVSNATLRENDDCSSRHKFNIVVYLTRSESRRIAGKANDSTTSVRFKPMLIELYNMKVDRSSRYRKLVTGNFHNFEWDIGEQGLFELHGKHKCQSANKQHHVSLNILLNEDTFRDKEDPESRGVGSKRNEAIISSLLELFVSVRRSMIYNFRSQFVNYESKTGRFLSTSFKIGQLPDKIHEIHFLGNVQIHESNLLTKMLVTYAQSLLDCLWLADEASGSSWTQPVYMVFQDSVESYCLIVTEFIEIDKDKTIVFKGNVITVSSNGMGELYKIERRPDREIVRLSNDFLFDQRKYKNLENRVLRLKENQETIKISKLQLRSFGHLPNPQGLHEKEVYSGTLSVVRGFRFLLPVSEDSVWMVASTREEFLSMHQCQALCLSDLQCRSFSYCIRSGSPGGQCVLSKLNIDSLATSERLKLTTQIKVGSRISLKAKDVFLLVSDSRCEIHNKLHLELFIAIGSIKTTLKGHHAYLVENEERCAEKCFERSLNAIKEGLMVNKQVDELLEERAPMKFESKIEQLHGDYKEVRSKFCSNFLYADKSSVPDNQKAALIRQKAVMSSKELELDDANFCLVEGNQELVLDIETDLFEFYYYKFDYSTLFEKRYNVRLLQSPLNKDEFGVLTKVGEMLDLSMPSKSASSSNHQQEQEGSFEKVSNYSTMRRLIGERKNFQQVLTHIDALNCAHLCLIKNSGLWPNCKSFDLVEHVNDIKNDSDKLETERETYCYLNSLTLDSAKPEDKYVNLRRSSQIWHYEPRFNTLQFSVEEENACRKRPSTAIGDQVENIVARLLGRQVPAYGQTICVLVGLVSGCFFGAIGSRKLDAYLKARKNKQNSESSGSANSSSDQKRGDSRDYAGVPYISKPLPVPNNPFVNDRFRWNPEYIVPLNAFPLERLPTLETINEMR